MPIATPTLAGLPSRRGGDSGSCRRRQEALPLRSRRRRRSEEQLPPSMGAPGPPSGEPRACQGWRKAPSERRRRRVLAACLLCLALLGWYTAGGGRAPTALEGPRREGTVLVLVWWRPFRRGAVSADCGRFNITACRLSTNHSLQPEAQAVVFHHGELLSHGLGQLPRQRPPEQRWVWMNFESPTHTPGLRRLGGLFNWTMSYRVDSDVFLPSGSLKLRPEPLARLPLPPKSQLVAWVVSNWDEGQARVRYYHQLKQHLPVDVYGAGRLSLKDNDVVQTVSAYKFYLAFENSQHQDYITEKLWRNAFDSWAVPVVLGPPRANYERFVPPEAFIHVEDFSDPTELARYVKFLDENATMYQKHLAWRKRYDVRVPSFWEEHCCQVCNAVREAGKQPKTIQDLAKWFES